MKNTRKMGIASLLLISLFLIQLIPSLGVKVKAAEPLLKVTITFKDGETPDGNPVLVEIPAKDIPDTVGERVTKITEIINDNGKYKEAVESRKGKYQLGQVEISQDDITNKIETFDKTKGAEVAATVKLTKLEPLKVTITFKDGETPDGNPVLVEISAKDIPDQVTARVEKVTELIKQDSKYTTALASLKDKYQLGEVEFLPEGVTTIESFDKTKGAKVAATVKLTKLQPLKITVNFNYNKTKATVDISVPAKDVPASDQCNEASIKALIEKNKDYKNKRDDLAQNYDISKITLVSDQIGMVKTYNEDKTKGAQLTIDLTLTAKSSTTTSSPTKPSVHKPSRTLNASFNKYGYRMGSLKLDQSSDSPELPDKLELTVESEPLRRSFASKAKVPVPQGDRLIAQYFNVSTSPSINLSKYDSTLTLKIDENGSSSAITVYQRVPGSKTWNRISRSQYSYDRTSGELEIEDLDDLGEFVVWINKDAREPQPQEPRPHQRLPLNPSVQVKPNGMLPQGVAPFPQANPQVQGSLMPQASQVPQVNPNAYLPVTGEKNYIGIMMGTLILACGALVLRKSIK